MKRCFASDNFAAVHPNILKAIEQVNHGYQTAYEHDEYSIQAKQLFQKIFTQEIDSYFVYGGCGGNVCALQALLQPHEAVISTDNAHIHTDECGAFEKFTGCKLFTVTSENGKLTKEMITPFLHNKGVEHSPQLKVISITQPTEYGTVYTIDEIRDLAEFAHKNSLYIHIDGARIANACVHLNTDLKTLIKDVNIDVLTLGGTKNGTMFGEAVIFLNCHLSKHFKFIRKQGMQLFSKVRFIAAQFLTLFEQDLFYENARHANEMAYYFYQKLINIPNVQITQKVEANSIFLIFPENILKNLQKKYLFYMWNPESREVRLMCSFQTRKEEIDEFISEI